MKFLWRLLLVLLLALPAGLLLLVFTEVGTRTLLQLAVQQLPVEIEDSSGTFAATLHIGSLRYEADGVRVELGEVAVKLMPECLWRGAVCAEKLHAAQLLIAILPDSSESAEAKTSDDDLELISFPFPIEVQTLSVENSRIHWVGGWWQAGPTRARVRLLGHTIGLSSAVMEQTRLLLQETETVEPDVDASPGLSPVRLPFDLQVSALQLIGPQWDFYGAAYRQDNVFLAGNWLRNELRLASLRVEDAELGQLSLRGALELAGDWPLQATAHIDLLEPLPQLSVLGQQLELTATGNLRALALQAALPGTVSVALEGVVDVLDPTLPFDAALHATSAADLPLTEFVAMPDEVAEAALRFPLEASMHGSLDTQRFALELAVSGYGYDPLQLAVQGEHRQGNLVFDQLSVIDPAGTGGLEGSGEITLADVIQWSLVVQSPGLTLPPLSDRISGRVAGELALAGTIGDDDWAVTITKAKLDGEVNDLPASIAGYGGLDSALQLQRSDFEARLNGAQLLLQASGIEQDPATVDLQVDDLSRWAGDARGRLQIHTLVSSNKNQFEVSANANDIRWGALRVDDGSLSGTIQLDAEQGLTLEGRLSGLGWGDFDLSSLVLSASGDASRQTLALTSEGDVQGTVSVVGTALDKTWRGELTATPLQTPLGDWVLSDPIKLAWMPETDQLSMAAHCWRHQHGKICPQDAVVGAEGTGSVAIAARLKMVAGLLPPGLSLDGDFQLDAQGQWSSTGIAFAGRSRINDITLEQAFGEGESASVDWESAIASFSYNEDALRLDASVQRMGRTVLEAELSTLAEDNAALTGNLALDQMQLAAFAPLVPAFSVLTGAVSGQVQLAGSLERPLARGTIALSDGHLVVAGNPTELDNLALSLDARGDFAEVRGSGELGGGKVQLKGQLRSNPDWQLKLNVSGDNQVLLYPPSTELKISENLQLLATRDAIDITGDVTVDSGVLKFEQLPEGSVAMSPSVVEVDHSGKVVQEALPFDVSMDVQVIVREQLRITGKNLDTTLGGDLRVQQQVGRPLQLFGQLNTVGGEVRAYQQRLVIRRGTMSFSGPATNPNVDVRAERDIATRDVTVGVRVQGPLQDELRLDIYSSPPMSQADAISYLVRGRPVDTGAGADGTALALSLASGVVNRSALVSELNQIPGISNVEFGAQGAEEDTAATVSGYLGERIYLSYGIGLYEPVNVLTARLYLSARLWFEVVSSLENSADLYYSFDID